MTHNLQTNFFKFKTLNLKMSILSSSKYLVEKYQSMFEIDYEIQKSSILSLMWKDLCNKKSYYKIKNNTKKTLTLYCCVQSTKIFQNYVNLGRKLRKKHKSDKFKLNTTVKFNQKIKKIVLKPYQKMKIYTKKLLPIYWINENDMLYSIVRFHFYEKIVFDEYEKEEVKEEEEEKYPEEKGEEVKEEEEEKYPEEKGEELQIIEEEGEEIKYPELKENENEYEKDMNTIKNNFNDIDELIKKLKSQQTTLQ